MKWKVGRFCGFSEFVQSMLQIKKTTLYYKVHVKQTTKRNINFINITTSLPHLLYCIRMCHCQEPNNVYERSTMKEDENTLLVYLLISLWCRWTIIQLKHSFLNSLVTLVSLAVKLIQYHQLRSAIKSAFFWRTGQGKRLFGSHVPPLTFPVFSNSGECCSTSCQTDWEGRESLLLTR